MGPMPFNPEPTRPEGQVPAGPLASPFGSDGGAGGGTDPLGQTRVTFSKAGHRFEFRCDVGHEAILARAVLDLAGRALTPLESGDAFALARQIEGMSKHSTAPGKPGVDSSISGLSDGGHKGHRKAA